MVLLSYYCGLLVCVFVTITVAEDFSVKGDYCAKFDSCYSKPLIRTCSCDEKCHMYGTCCHDVKWPLGEKSTKLFQCYSKRINSPVFVKRSCLQDYPGHEANIVDCLDDDEVDDMDIKNHLLVTSRNTKVTYWNHRCGLCNHEPEKDLEFWNVEVYCPQKQEVNRDLIRTNLTFNDDTKEWGLFIGEEFLHCTVKYAPPPYFDQVEHCTPNLVSTCPADFSDEDVTKKCSQYYGERKLKNVNIYYKNIHCAICNGVDMKDLECPGISYNDDEVDEADFREMVEQVFTNGEWRFKMKGNPTCSKGFLYDVFRRKCRKDEIPVVTSIQNSAKTCKSNIFTVLTLLVLIYIVSDIKMGKRPRTKH